MDEAERCHRLAILDEGRLVADDAPTRLLEALPAAVVEVLGADLRATKKACSTIDEVISVTQLGARLRVLIDPSVADAVGFLGSQLERVDAVAQVAPARASLEDVFVMATRE